MAVGYSAGGLLTLFTFGVVRSSAYFLPAQKVRTETPRLFQYDPKALLYQEQEKLIILRGEYEGNLMKGHATALQPTKVTVAGSGFGSKNNIKSHAKELARVLQTEGIIRVDHVLPTSTADELRTYLYELRMQSETLVQQGAIESIERFADVLLKTNRCDLTVPLESNLVATALNHVLRKSPVGELLKLLLSEKAILYELSCLMSDAGSQRQVMHPDTPWIEGKDASLYTCFIALQDIHEDMGPTTWMPGTHTQEHHALFQDETPRGPDNQSPKDHLLQTNPVVLGVLPNGCCGIFDSRLLHCGGANQSQQSRAIFYFSFKAPNVGYPGNPASIRRDYSGRFTLGQLLDELKLYEKGKPTELFRSY